MLWWTTHVELLTNEGYKMPGLTKKQMKIARVAPPRNKITRADFIALKKTDARKRRMANGKK